RRRRKLRFVWSRIGAQWRWSIFSIDAVPKFWRQPDDLFGPTLLFDRFASPEIDGVPSTIPPLECNRFESGRAREYHSRQSFDAILEHRKPRDYECETRRKWRSPSSERK